MCMYVCMCVCVVCVCGVCLGDITVEGAVCEEIWSMSPLYIYIYIDIDR